MIDIRYIKLAICKDRNVKFEFQSTYAMSSMSYNDQYLRFSCNRIICFARPKQRACTQQVCRVGQFQSADLFLIISLTLSFSLSLSSFMMYTRCVLHKRCLMQSPCNRPVGYTVRRMRMTRHELTQCTYSSHCRPAIVESTTAGHTGHGEIASRTTDR